MADSITDLITGLLKTFPQFKNELGQFSSTLDEAGKNGGDALKKLTEKFEEISKSLSPEKRDQFKRVFETIETGLKSAAKAAESTIEGFHTLEERLKDVREISQQLGVDLKAALNGANNETFELLSKFALLGAAAAGLTGETAFSKMDLNINAVNGKFEKLLQSAKEFLGIDLGKNGTAFIKNMMDGAEYSRQFESSIVNAAAKSGATTIGNNSNFLQAGRSKQEAAKELDDATAEIQKSAYRNAKAMGMPYEIALKQTVDILSTLPNEVEKLYSVTTRNINDKTVGSLELLQTVAKGTGQSFENVLESAKEMFASWGSDAKGAAERVSLISQASRELSIPFDAVKGQVKSIDDGFKMWGNSAQSTLGIMKEITQALKDQGLGYATQLEIMNNLSGAIRGLTVEKKAFIGMSNGLGGTAIGTDLQIEQMLQKGDWGKVAGMMQNTLSNIGGNGKVISMDEAISNPGQEQAFMTQRMALQNVFGVSDTGVANRLMDVMSKLNLGSELTSDGTKALQEAFSRGENIQEKQFSELENIHTELVSLRAIAVSRQAYQSAQDVFGAHGEAGDTRMARRDQAKISTDRMNLTSTQGRGHVAIDTNEIRDSAKNVLSGALNLATQTKEQVTELAKKAKANANTPSDHNSLPTPQNTAKTMPLATQNVNAINGNTQQIGMLNSNMSEFNKYLQDLTNRNSNQTNNKNNESTLRIIIANPDGTVRGETAIPYPSNNQQSPSPILNLPR